MTLVNKFGQYGSSKIGSWKTEKKKFIFTFQKVAKTGNIGKKSSGRQCQLCKIPQHAEG